MKITGQGVNLRLTKQGVKCVLWVRVDMGSLERESKKLSNQNDKAKRAKKLAKSAIFQV